MAPTPHPAQADSTPAQPQPRSPRVVPTSQGYDRWAAVYDTDGNPLIALEQPHVDRLLTPEPGARILDIGCGTGRHALRFAARALAAGRQPHVAAIDFSEGMLARARSKPNAESVRWITHDLTQPLPFEPASFDAALCALMLDHIQDLRTFFQNIRRICAPGVPLLVTVMHPAMMLKGVQGRFYDPASGEEIRPASVPNQISDYVTSSLAAGWTIDHMEEHACDEQLARTYTRAAKYLGWPMLLTMRLRA